MNREKIELAKLYAEAMTKAKNEIITCFHPNCNELSINSHILQKNGILSAIAYDNHLWTIEINKFREPEFEFKSIGINKAYSFKCFCNYHDTKLFEKIEGNTIDYSDYTSCLLFTLRALYNEIYRKKVVLSVNNYFLKERPDKFDIPEFIMSMEQTSLALEDLYKTENEIWLDLASGSRNFVFEHRQMRKLEVCLSSYYNYDTTEELYNYIDVHGYPMERTAEIFINFFPRKNDSILLMGYNKLDEKKVKAYFYLFFKEKENRVQRRITNLMLFNCETWVCSDKFYRQNVKDYESLFADTIRFGYSNYNERQTYDLNFYEKNFIDKLKNWRKKYIN